MIATKNCASRLTVRIAATILVAYATTLAPAVSYAQSDVHVSTLLTQIKEALDQVDSAAVASLPPLSRVTLNLKSVLEKESGGKFNLWIVRFGKKVAEEVVQTVSLELAPPRRRGPRSLGRNDRFINISEALANAIIATGDAVAQAQLAQNLVLHKLTATVRFGVSTDSEGGLSFQILPLTFDIGGNVDRQAIQEIIVEFRRPPGN